MLNDIHCNKENNRTFIAKSCQQIKLKTHQHISNCLFITVRKEFEVNSQSLGLVHKSCAQISEETIDVQ